VNPVTAAVDDDEFVAAIGVADAGGVRAGGDAEGLGMNQRAAEVGSRVIIASWMPEFVAISKTASAGEVVIPPQGILKHQSLTLGCDSIECFQ
jgi:hypothetical protein